MTKYKDRIKGGKADNKIPSDFPKAALEKGMRVEMEHTDDYDLACEIAMDHLVESLDYYDELEKMEKRMKRSNPEVNTSTTSPTKTSTSTTSPTHTNTETGGATTGGVGSGIGGAGTGGAATGSTETGGAGAVTITISGNSGEVTTSDGTDLKKGKGHHKGKSKESHITINVSNVGGKTDAGNVASGDGPGSSGEGGEGGAGRGSGGTSSESYPHNSAEKNKRNVWSDDEIIYKPNPKRKDAYKEPRLTRFVGIFENGTEVYVDATNEKEAIMCMVNIAISEYKNKLGKLLDIQIYKD